MLKRSLYFSSPAYLSVRYEQLVISPKEEGKAPATRPLDDIAYIFVDNAQITLTAALLQWLAQKNIAVVVCDAKHHPASMLLHLDVHHIQAERFRAQAALSEPLRKNLWMQTVKQKVRNQARVLDLTQAGNPLILQNLANKVSSGDSTNIEAQAARIYWQQLFGPGFARLREGPPPNPSLNYGYAIIRAAIARALVGSGLLPTLGIHHRNKYNSFALADDIMEPYRPFVDLLVWRQQQAASDYHHLTTERKQEFIQLLYADCLMQAQQSPLMVAMETTTASLVQCMAGERKKLLYPELPELSF
ncbi:MAG TPA: type II CRISPR-associated endonuclease Cas1 [Phnomibacter sp.]|nr:type II CRISPR-associated endonuclease Cas1 [Phnomibacter sp.]